MSDFSHRRCYISRSAGYKYRTFSTNTGVDMKRREDENTIIDSKFYELKRDICSRIENELRNAEKARQTIVEKYNKIDNKIDSLIEVQNVMTSLRSNIRVAQSSLDLLLERINNLEDPDAERFSLRSGRTSVLTNITNFEKDL